jgi:anti-sigma B factor antagonist
MEKDFEVKRSGNMLDIWLDKELTTANAPALTEELSQFRNQGIEKIVFDVTGLIYISSAGLRTLFFAYHDLGSHAKIVFVNCAEEIRDVLDKVGMTSFIKFEEDLKKKSRFRINHLCDLEDGKIEQMAEQRKKNLDSFSANNDVVCYSMKMDQVED